MFLPLDFIEKLIDLQDIKVTFVNVNDGIVEINAESKYSFAMGPKCEKITNQLHDKRIQSYTHLKICDRDTIINLTLRRFICLVMRNILLQNHFPS